MYQSKYVSVYASTNTTEKYRYQQKPYVCDYVCENVCDYVCEKASTDNKTDKCVSSKHIVNKDCKFLECIFCAYDDKNVYGCTQCTASFHSKCVEKYNWKCPVCKKQVKKT